MEFTKLTDSRFAGDSSLWWLSLALAHLVHMVCSSLIANLHHLKYLELSVVY